MEKQQDFKNTILLVEDDFRLAKALKRDFERRGFNVITAGCVRVALDKINSHALDAVITDWFLPDGTGKDVLKAIWQQDENKKLPVIVQSGSLSTEIENQAMPFEPVAIMEKPIEVVKLIGTLNPYFTN